MGHYANITVIDNVPHLTRGADTNKDQTYFLSQIDQQILNKLIFPIGHLPKSKVREIALQQQLVTATKKDSTGICFIGERNFNDFLSSYLKNKPGPVIDIETNELLGEHVGLFYHTIGQRKGLGKIGITANDDVGFFVAKKDLATNILYVCQGGANHFLKSNRCIVNEINELGQISDLLTVKFRYRSADVKCQITILENNEIELTYDPEIAVTPGQQAVFYCNDICLGGGTIKETF